MKPYPKYRDSEVEWIGELPEGWKVKKMKYLTTKVGSGVTPKGGASVYQNNGVALIRSQNIHFDGLRMDDVAYISEEIHENMRASKVRPLDVLLNITGASIGRCSIVPEDFMDANVNQHVCIIRPSGKITSKFLHAFLSSDKGQLQISLGEKGISREGLNFEQLKMFDVVIPPDDEQSAIATYLDRKTTQIDDLTAKKRRLIELLKEERAAVVNQAVIKGLDPSVKMKNSGVEWLGDVPEHWTLKPLKYVVTLQRGHDLPADKRIEGDVPVITSAGATGMHNQAMAKAPGIVTGRYGTIGTFYLIDTDYWPLNTTLYSINLYGNLAKYVWYMLQILSAIFLLNSSKSAVPGVDRNDLHPTMTAIPPSRDEQSAIVSFLDHKTTQIDQSIAKTEKQIQLLQEYRTALITEVVTGKIDVRDEVTA